MMLSAVAEEVQAAAGGDDGGEGRGRMDLLPDISLRKSRLDPGFPASCPESNILRLHYF